MWHNETNLIAVILLCILLFKTLFLNKNKGSQKRAFLISVCVCLVSTMLDLAACLTVMYKCNWWITEVANILYYISMPLLGASWFNYSFELIFPDDRRRRRRLMPLIWFPYLVFVAMSLSNPWTEWMFRLSDTIDYERGILYLPLCIVTIGFYFGGICVLLLLYQKRIRPRYQVFLLILFFSMTGLAYAVQVACPGWLIVNSVCASMLVLCDATFEDARRRELYRKISEQNSSLEIAIRQSREASDAKSRFLSRMSHEIRTPINAIIGMADLARQEYESGHPDGETLLDYVNETKAAAGYLLTLVNDVLDTSRIENDRIELHPREIDLDVFLKDIHALVRPLADEKQIQYLPDRKTHLYDRYLTDGIRLKQILVNLLNNAFKFTPAGGTVRLIAEAVEEENDTVTLRFTVSDTGIGISEEFQKNLFKPFAQENNGNTSPFAGTGLGLNIARELARKMDGDIICQSSLGVGTTFTVTVKVGKVTAFAEDQQSVEAAPVRDLSGLRVLLCEDHPLNQKITRALLLKRNCIVDLAMDGQMGVELFTNSPKGKYDVILMDIRMPNMDGLEATKRIRESGHPDAARIPIIAMSANAFEEDIRKSLDAGMNLHLAKPVDAKLLYEAIGRLVRPEIKNT